MKKLILALLIVASSVAVATPPAGYCDVIICNKLKRLSLSIWDHMQDSMGEECMPGILSIEDSVAGKELSSSTRFYQGSFNPTKRSVTSVGSVLECTKE
tara:strand:+ start:860 stop:1156 length:297 start_codon:yes stop_codon:yes gene_type:complete